MASSNAFTDLKSIDGEDFKRLGTAPILLRVGLVILAVIAVLAAVSWFLIIPKFDELKVVERKELTLRQKFDSEQAKAANRSAYVEQLEEMKKTFNVMLRQLPNKTDIESLLVDLSQTSVASGLDVKYFKPETEVPKEFYAEYPIKISVTGQYHEFGQFISGLAALPRIVTLSNIDISEVRQNAQAAAQQQSTGGKLKMDLVATTYRYIEEE
jgi:type IV pilus assembly protein PilO